MRDGSRNRSGDGHEFGCRSGIEHFVHQPSFSKASKAIRIAILGLLGTLQRWLACATDPVTEAVTVTGSVAGLALSTLCISQASARLPKPSESLFWAYWALCSAGWHARRIP